MRQCLHILVGTAFWVLLGALWAILLTEDRASLTDLLLSAQVIGVTAGLVLGATLGWIAHNVRIHRRKGPRLGRPQQPARIDADRLGRALVWAFDDGHPGALEEGHLVVELVDGAKVYRRP